MDLLTQGMTLIKQKPDDPQGYLCLTQYYNKDPSNIEHIKLGLPYFKILACMCNKDGIYYDYTSSARVIKNYEEALWGINMALKYEDKNIQYIIKLGYILFEMGDSKKGMEKLLLAMDLMEKTNEKTLKNLKPDVIVDYVTLIVTLCKMYDNDPNKAIKIAKFGIKVFPISFTEVLIPYTKSIVDDKRLGEQYFNEGVKYQSMGNLELASQNFVKACEKMPDFPLAHLGASQTLRYIGKHDLALKHMTKAHELDKDNLTYLSGLMHLLKATCKWEEFGEKYKIINKMIENKEYDKLEHFRSSGMYWGFDMELTCLLTQRDVDKSIPKQIYYKHNKLQDANKKLKIAFISSNFRNHAQGSQMSTFFREFNRKEFEIYAISIYPSTDPAAIMRKEILKAQVDNWIDAFDCNNTIISDETLAEIIYEHSFDIIIDLCGHADHPKLGAFAYKPAPIQISFLGYPGTTGAPFMDFYIGDPISTPLNEPYGFTEKLFLMPNTYQITEHRGEHPVESFMTKNIKKNNIVFCNFNQPVKIEHKMFITWMNILKNVKNSVLWLLEHTAMDNVRKEAHKYGVNGNRIIFLPMVGKREHLKRMQQADLLLDTTIYNAHTSAGDALWAGLPILTIMGNTMPSRVCSSMVIAAGFPEMIVKNFDEYEQRGIYLGNNLDILKKMRIDVENKREHMPLFDTQQYVRDFEKGLKIVWKQYIEKDKFESFCV